MRRRTKLKKGAGLDPALSFDGLPARTLPPVLTPSAVAKGLMPPLGVSALPPSLESAIPVAFRYWTAKSEAEAREVRDELVERAVIVPAEILKVDGVPRRVVWQAFLAVVDEVPVPLSKRTPVELAGAMCVIPPEGAEPVAMLAGELEGDSEPWTVERTAKAVEQLGGRVCIALADTAANRAAISELPTKFALETRPGVIYGSSLPLDPSAPHVNALVATEKAHAVRLLRKAEAEPTEERFVLGIVLEPDVVDSQNDTYDAAEVRKAAHRFMQNHRNLGKQHKEIVTGKLEILESYIAPVDFTIGESVVKAGTWMLAIRVVDDALWADVKAGTFTGFSIGGTAIREPEPTA